MIPVSGQPNGQGGPASPAMGGAGGIGGPTASPPGGTPKRMQRQRAPQTFAGMQQQGVARPTPELAQAQANANQLTAMNQQMQQQGAQSVAPTAASSLAAAQNTVQNASAGRNLGMYQTSQNAQALGQPLMQQVMALLQDPTQGLNEAAQSNFDRQNRVLGREFTTLREGLNENMAARGLDASTIAATKLGELGARQAEAQADTAARIQEQLIRDRSGAMNNAINAALGLRGQENEMGRDEYVINRDTGEMGWRREFDAAKMQQDASQFDRRLGLDTELGRGNLSLAQQRLGFDQTRDARDFGYQVNRDGINDQFRTDQFDWQKSTDARDFDRLTDRDRVGDDQFNRRFEFDVTRDTRDFNRLTDRDKVSDRQFQDTFDRAGTWRTEDNQYRDRRDAIGDQRFTDSWNRDQTWRTEDNQFRDKAFDTGQNNQTTQNLLGLLQGMGFNNLPPDVMNQIFRSLGINQSGLPVTTGGGGGSSPSNPASELGQGQYPGQSRTSGGVTFTWDGGAWRRN